jgi:hypothetical protein
MKYLIKKGTTSKRIPIFIQDITKADGSGLTGLTNASSGLTCYSWRESDGNVGGTSITLASATLGTFTSGGFKEKDATNLPGWYEFGVPNTVLATGSDWAIIMFKGATNMPPVPVEIQLTDWDPDTAVPANFASLAIDASGRIDLGKWLGSAPNALISGRPDVNVQAMANAVIAAATFAANAITSSVLDTTADNAIRDAVFAKVVDTFGTAAAALTTTCTFQQLCSIMLSVLAGVTSGNGATLKTPDGTSTRVAATIDANNNRTAMALTPST